MIIFSGERNGTSFQEGEFQKYVLYRKTQDCTCEIFHMTWKRQCFLISPRFADNITCADNEKSSLGVCVDWISTSQRIVIVNTYSWVVPWL